MAFVNQNVQLDAIVPDTEAGNEKWLELNTKYSEIWPNIKRKKRSTKR